MKVKVKNNSTNNKDNDSSDKDGKNTSQYKYTVTPLTEGTCSFFYVRTDNPDPKSFEFVDGSTELSDSKKCYISQYEKEFADVNYTDKKTLHVNGGYIFYGSQTDGGEWKLVDKKVGNV